MNIHNAFPSDYLKSSEIVESGDLTLTIAYVKVEQVGGGKDAEERPVLHFTDHKKGLVLNKGNSNKLSAAYGPETDGWSGKKVVIYFDPDVEFGGKVTGGLRVRIPAGIDRNGPRAASPRLSVEETDELNNLYVAKGISQAVIDKQLAHFQVKNVAHLTHDQAELLKKRLRTLPDMIEVEDTEIPF